MNPEAGEKTLQQSSPFSISGLMAVDTGTCLAVEGPPFGRAEGDMVPNRRRC